MQQNSYITSHAIVLYSHVPRSYKVILLDHQHGKVECIVRNGKIADKLMPGTMIEYSSQETSSAMHLFYADLIALPQCWVMYDIHFMHHVLELTQVYTPYNQGSEIFNILLMFYTFVLDLDNNSTNKVGWIKKIFIYNLLSRMGLYPEMEKTDYLLFSLISEPEDSMLNLQYDADLEQRLDMWLYRSLVHYNGSSQLKTFSFLRDLGIMHEEHNNCS